jgi:hypothetical protein
LWMKAGDSIEIEKIRVPSNLVVARPA